MSCAHSLAVVLAGRARRVGLGVRDRHRLLTLWATLSQYRSGWSRHRSWWTSATSRPNRAPVSWDERQVEPRRVREMRRRGLDALAHQRVGELSPGDGDPDVGEVVQRRGHEPRHERVHHLGARLNVARHRPRVVPRRGEREAAVEADEAVGRLEAGRPAARRRDPDRAAAVGAQGAVGEPQTPVPLRCRRWTRRASVRRDRVGYATVVGVVGRDAVGELVQVRLADVDPARGLEPRDGARGRVRDVVGEDRRAVRRAHARGVEQVLDRKPRPARSAGGGLELGDEDAVQRSLSPVARRA